MTHEELIANRPKLTPLQLKRINQQRVYSYIYKEKLTSKQAIAHALSLSLPTVTQSLTSFIEQGLIEKRGEYESTGGRKAQMICCNSLARVAVGVEILKEGAQIVAIDLYGTILKEDFNPTTFENNEAYYKQLGDWINTFVNSLPYERDKLLGVCITIQGLISPDGETITFSEILQCTGVKRETYQNYIDLPCSLIHDTEAAAIAEIWHRSDIGNAIYLALNRNFGGILIVNDHIHAGRELSSGIIEHMCLSPDGPVCYCGKQGCIETFCSADSLKQNAGMELSDFFNRVHAGEPRCSRIWRNYLRHLALAVDNIRMIVDCDFILGGFLMQYMNQADIELLTKYVKEQCAFDTPSFQFRISQFGSKSPKLGAAITLVENFLNSI